MADRLCDSCDQQAGGCPALQARVELPYHNETIVACKEHAREILCTAVQRKWKEIKNNLQE
jgi:hypothetical protein